MTKVRSIGVFSAAKVNGLLYGILGLLAAPFVLLGPFFAMLGGDGSKHGFGGAIFVAVLLPVFYGVIGFVFGAVMAFIYNAISHAIGGLEIELESPQTIIVNVPQVFSPPPIVPTPSDVPPPSPPEFG